MDPNALGENSPESLVAARNMAHAAVQLTTRAARANLKPEPDDSQSNLGWDESRSAFMSHPLPASQQPISVGVGLIDLKLMLVANDKEFASLTLSGCTVGEAENWLDAHMEAIGLAPMSSISLPYDLPADAAEVSTYSTDGLRKELRSLASWFGLANMVLTGLVAKKSSLKPGPSVVRCWPHHFDIATYISLEHGDSETARGIGVGLSPGDEGYREPYFYVNPWPHLETSGLPAPPVPGHWHTQGYVGMIATATELLSCPDVDTGTADFVAEAVSLGLART